MIGKIAYRCIVGAYVVYESVFTHVSFSQVLSQPCLQSARVDGEAADKMKKSIAPLSKTRPPN
jgi:hypothetical protein